MHERARRTMPARTRRMSVVACAAVLLLAACGGNDDLLKSSTSGAAASGATGSGARSGAAASGAAASGATASGVTPTTRPPATTLPIATGPDGYGTTECPPATGVAAPVRTFPTPFKRCVDTTKAYVATITTNKGVLTVNLDVKAAPLTVNNFVALARNKYFDGLSCHRIIPKFVAQCGDPLGTGTGGPGYKFIDELPKAGAYKVGSLAMANAGTNTNGSQFFIITGADGAALPPKYSLFGAAVNSDATIAALDAAGNPANNGVPPKQAVTITSVVITEK